MSGGGPNYFPSLAVAPRPLASRAGKPRGSLRISRDAGSLAQHGARLDPTRDVGQRTQGGILVRTLLLAVQRGPGSEFSIKPGGS